MSTEVKTVLSITGVAKFVTLQAPEPHPNFPEQGARYRIEFCTPKANQTELKPLMAAIQHVAKRTWVGAEAVKRMKGVQRTIVEGDGEQSGMIGLLDGDAYKPEFNAGTYVIRASARGNQRPVYRRWNEETQSYQIVDKAPEGGDLVRVLIEVWAMKQHPRINLTVKAVQVMKGGEGFMPVSGGTNVTEAMLEEELAEPAPAVLSLFEGMRSAGVPAIGSGIVEETPAPALAAPAPAKRGRPKKAAEPAPPPPVTYDDEPGDGDDLFGGDDGEELLAAAAVGGGLFDDL